MNNKPSANSRAQKPNTSTSIQVNDRLTNDQRILLGSKQPGHGFFVQSKSLKESETKFKISSSKQVLKPISATDLVRGDAVFKAESTVLEIVEKELTQALGNLEDKNKDLMLMQIDLDKLHETVTELEEVNL